MRNDEAQHLSEQTALSRRLALGFAGTFAPPFGVYAWLVGWRALIQIDAANSKLVGRGLAVWCFVVGLIETIMFLPALLMIILNRL